ncbi:5'-methylthioadenosine/S-adenosylhomocysteine nucleosidase family protein [Saccharopolyspora sp. 5N708]|uniref:5'-methylthioadenosine/S-adenosylhomocysteine nucleosidase family protein n=1 Tax=Saccharopolyspora sp. 5N708 TaxID=3457424 RepID=UPI003FCF89F1
MPETSTPEGPSFGELLYAARAVRQAEHGRQSINTIRPREATGLYRSRPPLPLLLYLARREGRLVWRSTDAFAVVDPPSRSQLRRPGGRQGTVWTKLLNGYWDLLVCFGPSGAVLCLAFAFVFFPAIHGLALILVGAVLLYVVVLYSMVLVKLVCWLYQRFSGNARRYKFASEAVCGQHWSMPLCHIVDSGQSGEILEHARFLASYFARDTNDPEQTRSSDEVLICVESGITTDSTRFAVRANANVIPLPNSAPGLLVIRGRGEFRMSQPEPTGSVGAILLLPIGAVVMAAIHAQHVTEIERSACEAAACGAYLTGYMDVLYWLLAQLIPFTETDGPTPATWQARVSGPLMALIGLTTAAAVTMEIWRLMKFQKRSIQNIYEEFERSVRTATRILVLVVTDAERDAIIASVRAESDMAQFKREYAGDHTIFRLGTVGTVEIFLAQSQQGTGSPGAMTLTAVDLIDAVLPDYVILAGICFGLKEDEQEIGDILVSENVQNMDHKKIIDTGPRTTREIQRGARPDVSVKLLNRCRSATADWTGNKVHFGLIISANTLVNSALTRAKLKTLAPDALGGEMEGAGLYAASFKRKIDWILIKGISDWGENKTDEFQKAAAGAAADYVVHVVKTGGLSKSSHSGPATREAYDDLSGRSVN